MRGGRRDGRRRGALRSSSADRAGDVGLERGRRYVDTGRWSGERSCVAEVGVEGRRRESGAEALPSSIISQGERSGNEGSNLSDLSCADSVDGDGLISTSRMKRDGRGTGAGQHGRVDEGEETIRLKANELTEGSKRVEDAVEMTGVAWLAVCLSWTDESTNLRRGFQSWVMEAVRPSG